MSFNKKQYRDNEWGKRSKIKASERNQFKQQMWLQLSTREQWLYQLPKEQERNQIFQARQKKKKRGGRKVRDAENQGKVEQMRSRQKQLGYNEPRRIQNIKSRSYQYWWTCPPFPLLKLSNESSNFFYLWKKDISAVVTTLKWRGKQAPQKLK